jgi:hypothetical protein
MVAMNVNRKEPASLPIRTSLTAAYAISLVIGALMAVASVAGLLVQTVVYPTDELLESFVPNDVVNLFIGLPILLGSVWLARRGRLVGLLLWPGALFYVFYSYLVYVLSMPLGVPYMLHLTLVALSAYTMIGLVASIEGTAVRRRLAGAVSERAGGGVLVGLGLLILVRVIVVVAAALTSRTPVAEVELALHVSDFMLAPAWIIGGVLLWRRETLGYVSGLGLLFQGSMLFIGLIAVLILQPLMIAAPFPLTDVLVVFVMGMVCFIPFALFVRGAASGRNPPTS